MDEAQGSHSPMGAPPAGGQRNVISSSTLVLANQNNNFKGHNNSVCNTNKVRPRSALNSSSTSNCTNANGPNFNWSTNAKVLKAIRANKTNSALNQKVANTTTLGPGVSVVCREDEVLSKLSNSNSNRPKTAHPTSNSSNKLKLKSTNTLVTPMTVVPGLIRVRTAAAGVLETEKNILGRPYSGGSKRDPETGTHSFRVLVEEKEDV